jgi:hypothetical protein
MMSSPNKQLPFKEPSSPIGRTQLGLAASFVIPSPKTKNGDSARFVNDEPFIGKRKPASTMVAKPTFNNGEHTLIPVTAKMIHSAVSECQRLVLKDGWPLHMVKFVGAVRNFSVNTKYVKIDVEDGMGLVRVILWRKEKECTAQCRLIHWCNSNCYIRVIGKIEDYYGVHKIIAFNVWPVSSGNEVTHHFLEVAYSFERTLEYAEDEMLRAVNLK